jgi:hypothetical protein
LSRHFHVSIIDYVSDPDSEIPEGLFARKLKEISLRKQTVEWRLDHHAKIAREELLSLQPVFHPDLENPAKVLEIKTKDKEYVSIRRLQGDQLMRAADTPSDSWNSSTIFEVDPRFLPEGSIGILVFPSTASCTNQEIWENYNLEDSWGQGFELEYALYYGAEYHGKDWKVCGPVTTFVKNQDGRIYRLWDIQDQFDHKPSLNRIEPNSSGKLEIYSSGSYQTDEEIKVKRELWEKLAVFYVLIEGKSNKDRDMQKLTRLVPVHQEQVQGKD